jgi:hypothetical protein
VVYLDSCLGGLGLYLIADLAIRSKTLLVLGMVNWLKKSTIAVTILRVNEDSYDWCCISYYRFLRYSALILAEAFI